MLAFGWETPSTKSSEKNCHCGNCQRSYVCEMIKCSAARARASLAKKPSAVSYVLLARSRSVLSIFHARTVSTHHTQLWQSAAAASIQIVRTAQRNQTTHPPRTALTHTYTLPERIGRCATSARAMLAPVYLSSARVRELWVCVWLCARA